MSNQQKTVADSHSWGRNQHVTEMAALGRPFQLGSLYDYRNDTFPNDSNIYWKSTSLTSAVRVEGEFELELKSPEFESWNNKWEKMGLDEHSKMSAVAGIIDKFKGASKYLDDQPGPSQATRTLVCRVKVRKQQFNLPDGIINEDGPRIASEDDKYIHVVVGITYGAEAYCVFFHDLKSDKIEQDILDETEDQISKITDKMESALEEQQDVGRFKEQFDREEKKFISRLKVRLYADLQSSSVRECSVFDAYKHCLKLIEQMKSNEGRNKAVPISVQLCPLAALSGLMDEAEQAIEYHDVDGDLVARSCRMWAELEQVSARSDALKKVGRQFGTVLRKYQDMLRKSLKMAVIKARESDDDKEIERIIDIAETHSLFKLSRLNRWLRYKQAEGEMTGKMTNLAGITYLSNQKQFEKEVAESFNKKHALVLYVPPLDERTNEILQDMTDYVESFTKLVAIDNENDETDEEEDGESEGMPWHTIQRKRNQVLAQIREFVDHVDKNKHLENKVQFLITSNEAGKRFGFHYSVYEAGKLFLTSIQLPVPPTGLLLNKVAPGNSKRLSVRVEWNHEDLGYPSQFLVEYRLKDSSDPWKQQFTIKPGEKQSFINYQKGSAIEIRVATDTCIGRSEFSDIVDTESDLISSSGLGTDLVSQTLYLLKNCTKMAAMGRRFQLGVFYDYHNDRILADDHFKWKSIPDSTVQTDVRYKLQHFPVDLDTKWELVGRDKHLRVSVMAGFINKYRGASNFLNDRTNPTQAISRVIVIRAKTRKERLDFENNLEDIPPKMGEATHVVVGVTFGAEAYCVLAQDLETKLDYKEALEMANDNLSELATKFIHALGKEDDEKIDSRLAEIGRLNEEQVKCRVYADLQDQAVKELNFINALRHCMKLMKKLREGEAIPIAVQLCPLELMLGSDSSGEGIKKVKHPRKHHDVDAIQMSRWCRLWEKLERVIDEAMAVCTTSGVEDVDLKQFVEAVGKFRNFLRNSLKSEVVKVRHSQGGQDVADNGRIGHFLDIAERHSLFGSCRLEQWLKYKKSEMETKRQMHDTADMPILPSRNDLENELASSSQKKYALVMWVPSLNERTDEILEAMKNYVENYAKLLVPVPDFSCKNTNQLPWHTDDDKRKLIIDQIRYFVDYATRNKSVENGIHFFIAFADDCREQIECHYSIYRDNNVLKENLDQLPGPPTSLRIRTTPCDRSNRSPLISVSWDYEDLGYSCHFLVEYRVKGDNDKSWNQHKTDQGVNQVIIHIHPGSVIMEVRVATDSCIGRSAFSDIVDTESLFSEFVPSELKLYGGRNSFVLDKVLDGGCPPDVRIAEFFTKDAKFSRMLEPGQPAIYLLNAREHSLGEGFRSMDIGLPDGAPTTFGLTNNHKVIILMGVTGCGKSTLINGMVNYILGVQWKDTFRFKCIREDESTVRNQALSQTSSVTAYTIHHREGMTVPYSITIIDTPEYGDTWGDTRGVARDKEITKMIHRFLTNSRINEIHAACFVACSGNSRLTATQGYILDSVLSIFGKDFKGNVRLLVTFTDINADPPVVQACSVAHFPVTSPSGEIAYCKFDSFVLYASNVQQDDGLSYEQLYWDIGQENFEKFFTMLEGMNGTNLESTPEVIHRRQLMLERSLKGIERELEECLDKIEKTEEFQRKLRGKLREYGHKMEMNKNFKTEKTVTRLIKIDCDDGYIAYNCRQCKRTCDGPLNKKNKPRKGNCNKPPCSCPHYEHEFQTFKWLPKVMTTIKTLLNMKAEYELNCDEKMNTEQLIQKCSEDLDMAKAKVFSLLDQVGDSVRSLESTALRSNTLSPSADYLSLMRSRVAEEQKPGYMTRLETLAQLQRSLAPPVLGTLHQSSSYSGGGIGHSRDRSATTTGGGGSWSPGRGNLTFD